MLPVRCYTCGKVLGQYEDAWNRLSAEMTTHQLFDHLGINKLCCRMHMLCSFQKLDIVLDYERANELFIRRDTSHHYVTVHTVHNDPEPKPRIVEGR